MAGVLLLSLITFYVGAEAFTHGKIIVNRLFVLHGVRVRNYRYRKFCQDVDVNTFVIFICPSNERFDTRRTQENCIKYCYKLYIH